MAAWTAPSASGRGASGVARITVWATPAQWEQVRRLGRLCNWTETDLGKRAGFTKDQWRDFYGRRRAAGLLLPKGNGPKAGFRPHAGLLQVLERQPWGGK